MKHRLINALLLLSASLAVAQAPAPIPIQAARSYFDEAQALCRADDGRLWGVSLCGPMMFVDPDTREIVANQADSKGLLKPTGSVYSGTLPAGELVANTAVEWSGAEWTQILWPLPQDQRLRDTLMLHELFHRIQAQIGLAPTRNPDNIQLDTLDGRYTLELEWRALTRALEAQTDADRRAAASDALLFRAERYRIFPDAAVAERALERNEGLAEYTGVRVGNPTADEQTEAALHDLSMHAKDSTFVRSFAYATGPGYGLLLDRYDPAWRDKMKAGGALDTLLAKSLAFTAPRDLHAAFEQRAAVYDDGTLLKAEQQREAARQQRLAAYRAKFIDGPTLTLPLSHMKVEFDPRTLEPLDKSGTIYPGIHVRDDWGALHAPGGALLKPDWSAVIVPAPASIAGTHLEGNGWTLDLEPGWKIVPGARSGDYRAEPEVKTLPAR